MPQFGRIGELHTVSIVTGPKHVWLGVSFSTTPVANPQLFQRPAIGQCSHGGLNPEQVSAAVVAGIAEANVGLFPTRIEFVANDTPDYVMFRICAQRLAEQVSKA